MPPPTRPTLPMAASTYPTVVRDGTRRRALVMLPVGLLLAAVGVGLALVLSRSFKGFAVFAIPALLVLPLLKWSIEAASGIPLAELSARWDDLRGWQRGLLGSFIALLAFGLMASGVIFYASTR